jgi:predicted RNA-binding Zn ribbon-like protein
MPEEPKRRFDFSGGHLALDFANTVSNRPTPARLERLDEYRNLVHFGDEAGLYPPGAVDHLYAVTGAAPGRGKTALQGAIQLREAIFAIFTAVVGRRAVPGNALALLNAWVRAGGEHARVSHTSRHFQWEYMGMDSDLYSVLWPIARSAAELLTSGELSRLRVCASPQCDWLFLDQTKNHRRRWCDMKVCGNRRPRRARTESPYRRILRPLHRFLPVRELRRRVGA